MSGWMNGRKEGRKGKRKKWIREGGVGKREKRKIFEKRGN